MLSRLAKLLLLFFAPQNPLWADLIDGDVTNAKIAAKAKLSQSTLANWKKGGAINIPRLTSTFNMLVKSINIQRRLSDARKRDLISLITNFREQCTTPSDKMLGVYVVAQNLLSLSIPTCQKILDEIVYDNFTLFPSLTFNSFESANTDFQKFKGLYHLYVRRELRCSSTIRPDVKSASPHIWLLCPLRVRYLIRTGTRYLIRCKLNAPIIRKERTSPPYSEYDGFLRSLKRNVAWKFSNRNYADTDFFDFITNIGEAHGEVSVLWGTYLTTGQDSSRSIEHSDAILQEILLRQIAGDDYTLKTEVEIENIIADWMHNTASVIYEHDPITAGKWKEINSIWKTITKDQ